jgi:hypothetical protein
MTLVSGTGRKDAEAVFVLLRRLEQEREAPELVIRTLQLLASRWKSFPPEALARHGAWMSRYIEWIRG